MRDSLQPRRRWPGAALCLLLALVLGACPGGDTGEKDDPSVAADSTQTQEAAASRVAATCEPPPVTPDSLLRNGQPWAQLEAWLATHQVTFPDDSANVAVASVPLCPQCDSVRVELRSTNRTYCMTVGNAAQRRIAGQMTLLAPFAGKDSIQQLPAGTRILMFSKGSPQAPQPATLVYNYQGNVTQMPAAALWKFYYCEDLVGGTRPEAQWRKDRDHCQRRGQGPKDDFEGPGGGTYGWMACANGCCQFYTPPPAEEFP